jgi:hypothetical protein
MRFVKPTNYNRLLITVKTKNISFALVNFAKIPLPSSYNI